jgi:hypothetical protein
MPLSTAEALRLVDAQAAARDRVEAATLTRVERLVAVFRGWWSDAEVEALAQQVSMVVLAGQTAVSRATDAYLARVISDALGRPVPPVGVPITPERWRTADPLEVYQRPAADVRRRVAAGEVLGVAEGMAAQRYRSMVSTDLALATTHTSREVYQRRGSLVDGYRRVTRPEASRGGTCGLCVAASDRIYSRGDLMPIHDKCKCQTLPIVSGQDPGRSLVDAELRALYDDAGGTAGAKLKRTRYQVNEHGELGPVLREQGHHFRGPAEVAAA